MPSEIFQSTDAALLGERTNHEGRRIRNRILLAIPDSEYEALRPLLSFVDLPRHARLFEPGEKLEFACFLNRGLVSLMVVTKEAKTVEVSVAGNESLLAIPATVGLNEAWQRAVVQIGGDGFRIRAAALRTILPSTPRLRLLLSRLAVIQGMQAAQTSACNRLHGIEQRLARWLLIMQDHANDDPLLITHDFLAATLGTDRPSVSLAAGSLQRQGVIKYSRGVLNILDRERVEKAACECYRVIQELANVLWIE